MTAFPAPTDAPAPLLSVRRLHRRFAAPAGLFRRPAAAVSAVDDVSFDIARGEIVGLIGPSGSGKTTIGRLVTGLDRPDGGVILFEGRDLATAAGDGFDRRRHIQMVPQDTAAALNPRRRIGHQIADPLLRFGLAADRDAARRETFRLLRRVGLAEDDAERFPHAFSGGQRQRINIARALAVRADLLVLDEPTSALDVSIQARILDLLHALKQESGLTYLFIGHNLAVIQSFCQRVMVMEKGVLVDSFAARALGAPGRHPATRRLVEAVLPVHAAPPAA